MASLRRARSGRDTAPAAARRDATVRRFYEKAKQLGTWDPAEIDLGVDAADWPRLGDDERDLLLRVLSLFLAGEEAVTRDLLPVAFVVANEGRLDDELFVTAWLWEEGKHADFFRRYLDEVVGEERPQEPEGHRLLAEELPNAMSRLLVDSSPGA